MGTVQGWPGAFKSWPRDFLGGVFGPMGQTSEATTATSVQKSAWSDDKVEIVVRTQEGPSPIVPTRTIL